MWRATTPTCGARSTTTCRRGARRCSLILDRAQARGELAADTDLDVLIDVILGPFAYRKLLAHTPIDEGFAEKLLAIVLPNLR